MKTIGLTLILCSGILVLLFLLVPVGVTVQLNAYPQERQTINGQVRVAQIVAINRGWFTQRVQLPELTACAGDQEIPLDAWTATGNTIVPGVGQRRDIVLRAGESGTVYYVAQDTTILDSMHIYRREAYFSCLNPGIALD